MLARRDKLVADPGRGCNQVVELALIPVRTTGRENESLVGERRIRVWPVGGMSPSWVFYSDVVERDVSPYRVAGKPRWGNSMRPGPPAKPGRPQEGLSKGIGCGSEHWPSLSYRREIGPSHGRRPCTTSSRYWDPRHDNGAAAVSRTTAG